MVLRQVYKNLLNENGLPHTAADPNAHSVCKTLLKEYGLPHTVAEWYSTLKFTEEYGLPHTVAECVRHKH